MSASVERMRSHVKLDTAARNTVLLAHALVLRIVSSSRGGQKSVADNDPIGVSLVCSILVRTFPNNHVERWKEQQLRNAASFF